MLRGCFAGHKPATEPLQTDLVVFHRQEVVLYELHLHLFLLLSSLSEDLKICKVIFQVEYSRVFLKLEDWKIGPES